MRIPYAEFGAAAVDSLERLWRGKPAPARLLPHHLVVRDGVAPA